MTINIFQSHTAWGLTNISKTKDQRSKLYQKQIAVFLLGGCIYKFEHNIGVFNVLEWYELIINVGSFAACKFKPVSFRIYCIASFKYLACIKNSSNVSNMCYVGHKLH